MKVFYKSVLNKVNDLLEQHLADEENEIEYILLDDAEFDELVNSTMSHVSKSPEGLTRLGKIVEHLAKQKDTPYTGFLYRKFGIDWCIIKEGVYNDV